MKVYKVFYKYEDNDPTVIKIIKEGGIRKYVNELIVDGIIEDGDIEIWEEKHHNGIQTETDAVELLETAGFYVEKTDLHE